MAQAITEPLDLQGTYSPKLEFWYAHDNQAADARDQINIYISVDGDLRLRHLLISSVMIQLLQVPHGNIIELIYQPTHSILVPYLQLKLKATEELTNT